MCLKAGESVIVPITNAAMGVAMSSTDAGTTGWACDKTECPSYGKWYCPFSW